MSFWEDVNAGIKHAVAEGWHVLKDSAHIGRLRYDRYMLHRKAERFFAELGGHVFESVRTSMDNPLTRPEVERLIEEIRGVEAEISGIDEEIAKTRAGEEGDDDEKRPGGPETGGTEGAIPVE